MDETSYSTCTPDLGLIKLLIHYQAKGRRRMCKKKMDKIRFLKMERNQVLGHNLKTIISTSLFKCVLFGLTCLATCLLTYLYLSFLEVEIGVSKMNAGY